MTTISQSVTSSGNAFTDTQTDDTVIVNAGVVLTGSDSAVSFRQRGTLSNFGTLSGGVQGVQMSSGGTVVNEAGGFIAGNSAGIQISSGGDVRNQGVVGTTADTWGVRMLNGGTVYNSAGGDITGSFEGVLISGGVVENAGTIGTAGMTSRGIAAVSGSVVLNLAGGKIVANADGVIASSGGSVSNYGSISATASGGIGVSVVNGGTVENFSGTIFGNGDGIRLSSGGTVSNVAGATISGTTHAINAGPAGGPLVLSNFGTIASPNGEALLINNGGTVYNGGTMVGDVVASNAAVTLTNAGTISGSVDFGSSTSNDRLILAPGSVITGGITVQGAGSVLELEAGSGSFDDLPGNGSGFASVVFDSGAHWTLGGGSPTGITQTVTLHGNNDTIGLTSPGDFSDAISGLVYTDSLDLIGLAYAPGAVAQLNGTTLTVTSNDVTDSFQLPGIAPNTTFFTAEDSSGGVLVEVACYCPGTLVLTERGEAAVESLAVGERVITASGALLAIRWIGRRSYAARFLAGRPGLLPIRLRAGCLGGGLPRRDLLVSPKHAMLLDGVLVPAELLLNGSSIVREHGMDRVDYFHVELDRHDVLLAEGAPSESYLDDGSREMFQNAAEFEALYPDAPRSAGFCAPRVEQGVELEAIRRRLAVVSRVIARAA